MLKGFLASPENFIPHRTALKLPLDAGVVQEMSRMTSLNLGLAQSISEKLCGIVESRDYRMAAKATSDVDISSEDASIDTLKAPSKRSMFHFCRRRKQENRPAPQFNLVGDLAGFHPLVSIYHLTREKIERERDAMSGEYIPPLTRVSDSRNHTPSSHYNAHWNCSAGRFSSVCSATISSCMM
jgi:hypothetical protein